MFLLCLVSNHNYVLLYKLKLKLSKLLQFIIVKDQENVGHDDSRNILTKSWKPAENNLRIDITKTSHCLT